MGALVSVGLEDLEMKYDWFENRTFLPSFTQEKKHHLRVEVERA
jgi:hypothetical protein